MAVTRGKKRWIATDSGAVEVDGETRIFVKDKTLVRDDDPMLKQIPHCFEPLDGPDAEVEQATAAPGERRRR